MVGRSQDIKDIKDIKDSTQPQKTWMAKAEGGGEKELSGTRLNKLCIALILYMSMDLIIVTYICLMSYILKDILVK